MQGLNKGFSPRSSLAGCDRRSRRSSRAAWGRPRPPTSRGRAAASEPGVALLPENLRQVTLDCDWVGETLQWAAMLEQVETTPACDT